MSTIKLVFFTVSYQHSMWTLRMIYTRTGMCTTIFVVANLRRWKKRACEMASVAVLYKLLCGKHTSTRICATKHQCQFLSKLHMFEKPSFERILKNSGCFSCLVWKNESPCTSHNWSHNYYSLMSTWRWLLNSWMLPFSLFKLFKCVVKFIHILLDTCSEFRKKI